MTSTISGIHHITAMSGPPQRNIDFYSGLLGLRLVKVTVNYDDPGTFHLYYGDGAGNPGTILTFFPWPGALPGSTGSGMVDTVSFAITPDSLAYWSDRLTANGVAYRSLERLGEKLLKFTDPDGMALELVASDATDPQRIWSGGPVPGKAAIRGFHSATLLQRSSAGTARLLEETMGFHETATEGARVRFTTGSGAASQIVDVLEMPDSHRGRVSVGTVHHIAWRTPDDASEKAFHAALTRSGYNVSPVMDRTYFHSIYWREPGGVLFEVATDPPGFTVDEPASELGSRLVLPAWLEPMRDSIESHLPVIQFTGNTVGAR